MSSFELPILRAGPPFTLAHEVIQTAWLSCGADGDAPDWFRVELIEILRSYSQRPLKHVSMPAKERNKFYNNIGNATQALLVAIDDLPDRIDWELQQTYTCNEPENVDDILTGDDEGLTFGEYELERLTLALKMFQAMTHEARKEYKPQVGRPQQNENLERTIVQLATLYEQVTGEAAMSGYTYQELDKERPYQSPFLSFVTTLLWTHNQKNFPTNPTIGEAARKAFGLRK